MILAAGRGERLRPLTDHTPKPLIAVGGKPLIEYHLEKLAQAGVKDVVINLAYLGHKIHEHVGDGSAWRLNIKYSQEPEPLETGGAINRALPLLGEQPFALINGDVWTDAPFIPLVNRTLDNVMGHLLLVNNPTHNPSGDFSIDQGLLHAKGAEAYTFSGMSVLSPEIIKQYPRRRRSFPLREVFDYYLQQQNLQQQEVQKQDQKKPKLSAELCSSQWWDVGTLDRLQSLESLLTSH